MRICRTHRRLLAPNFRRLQGLHLAQSLAEAAGLRFAPHDLRIRIDHVCICLHLECGFNRPWVVIPASLLPFRYCFVTRY